MYLIHLGHPVNVLTLGMDTFQRPGVTKFLRPLDILGQGGLALWPACLENIAFLL